MIICIIAMHKYYHIPKVLISYLPSKYVVEEVSGLVIEQQNQLFELWKSPTLEREGKGKGKNVYK